jgi:hypothetical protein
MELVPPYNPPPPPLITKSIAIQLSWERQSLIQEANTLARVGWQLIKTKGTASNEYQELFVTHSKICHRISEINTLVNE